MLWLHLRHFQTFRESICLISQDWCIFSWVEQQWDSQISHHNSFSAVQFHWADCHQYLLTVSIYFHIIFIKNVHLSWCFQILIEEHCCCLKNHEQFKNHYECISNSEKSVINKLLILIFSNSRSFDIFLQTVIMSTLLKFTYELTWSWARDTFIFS